MRYSKLFIPTLRETPSDAEAASHKLMLRAGYIRQLAAGLYIILPLAQRVIDKVNTIIREEMDSIGALEITMPVLQPAEIWQETGRWYVIKDEMFRLKDRGGRDMCLGMTHEEVITWLASREIRSYRDLPQVWYQIQTKMRDEARPKGGLLRTREFHMKDSYSFDADEAGLDENYRLHAEAYHRIFQRCGLEYYQCSSDPGMMGGAQAHEFMAPSPFGEDDIVICPECGYSANVELAVTVPPKVTYEDVPFEEVHTPGMKTVEEVSGFLKAGPHNFIKSLLYITEQGPVLALVRGDREVHEKKLEHIIGTSRPAEPDEIMKTLGVEVGYIGPMGHKVRKIADVTLKEGVFTSGANKSEYHARGIRPGEHFEAEWHDIQVAKAGDYCSECGTQVNIIKCIEIGNIFKLGTKYSEPLKAVYLDEGGKERTIIMGSYGIGPARVAAAAVEQGHDKDGIIWPRSIAPFDVEVISLNMAHEETVSTAEKLYQGLTAEGLDVLYDDRDERAGVKFKDADLVGIPVQVVVGERGLKEGVVEIKERASGEKRKVPVAEAIRAVKGE